MVKWVRENLVWVLSLGTMKYRKLTLCGDIGLGVDVWKIMV